MEEFGSTVYDGISTAVRRKRSQASRRPRPESQASVEGRDPSPSSSTAPSDDVSKISSDENAGCDTNTKRKEFNLNQCIYREEYAAGNEGENTYKKSKRFGDVELGFAPTDSKSMSKMIYRQESKSRSTSFYSEVNGEYPTFGKSGVFVDGFGGDGNKVKKVKLKVGGVTRTIQANSAYNGVSGSESSAKSSRASDSNRHQLKEVMLDNNNLPGYKKSTLQGIPWKDFSRVSFSVGREDSMIGKMSWKNFGKEVDKSESVRKSKRVPKKRLLDEDFGDDEEDDEIRYLEKLKTSKAAAVYKEDDEESSKKLRKLYNVSNTEMASGKKSRSDRVSEETEYEEEEDSATDIDVKVVKKKQRKESVESVMNSKREMTLTTRQRALQSSRETSFAPGGNLIEFPNGLPPAPPRKQKEKLSEVEQHLKKVEAAQKRRMQVEKAARESEAEAIRKILGQDSSRKKREEKLKKRQEELAQEKAANAQKLASNTIRWVLGPTGTVVTFPTEMGLPSILEFKACSYPPPRENCVGPSCGNPYKYRDSKSKLPLCSLHCYKAIQGKMLAETTC